MMRMLMFSGLVLLVFSGENVRAVEEKKGEISSEATCGATPASGKRNSKTSDWTKFPVPDGYVINKSKTKVHVISQRGSEHTYKVEYGDDVEIIPGTGIMQPTTIKAQTHSRSSKGAFGGGGNMKIRVEFYYVKYKVRKTRKVHEDRNNRHQTSIELGVTRLVFV